MCLWSISQSIWKGHVDGSIVFCVFIHVIDQSRRKKRNKKGTRDRQTERKRERDKIESVTSVSNASQTIDGKINQNIRYAYNEWNRKGKEQSTNGVEKYAYTNSWEL